MMCIYVTCSYHRRFNATKQRMRALGLLDSNSRSVLLEMDDFEIPRTNLQLNRKLGEGCFGAVYGGEGIAVVDGEDRTPVAVKTLRPGAEAQEKVRRSRIGHRLYVDWAYS